MTNDEAMRVDAEEAAGMMVVDFGEAGQKQWRDELRAAAGMRELARLLLAGVPQEEAYRLAVELESKQSQATAQAGRSLFGDRCGDLRAFCATGTGGGIDNSCGSGKQAGGLSGGTSGKKSGGTKAQKTRQTNKAKKQAQSDIESLGQQKSAIGAAIESDRWRGNSHGQAESINKLKERVPGESKEYDNAVSAAGDAELEANVARFKFEKDPTGVTEQVIKTPLSEEQWKQTPAYKKWQASTDEVAKAEKKLKAAMLKKLDEVHAKQVARVEKELQDKLSEIDGA